MAIRCEKFFTRDNGLLVFELWDKCETEYLNDWLGWSMQSYILNAVDGVTEVYYDPKNIEEFKERVAQKLKEKDFLPKVLRFYKKAIAPLKTTWKRNGSLRNKQELINLFDQGVLAWIGLAITYFIPGLDEATLYQKKSAMLARKGTDCFFDATDDIFQKTLKKIFPHLGTLSRFITIEELREERVPSKSILEARQKHFIFYERKIFTNVSLQSFAKRHGFVIKEETIPNTETFRGQIAMMGRVTGKVRIIMRKEDINLLRKGEILITSMTTPDFLPAMNKAAAFITDEGGITSHAAIVAREMKKPCIIGTKIATKILKNGNLVEVDANRGVVKILK